jgi:phage baseplate assembly protein W
LQDNSKQQEGQLNSLMIELTQLEKKQQKTLEDIERIAQLRENINTIANTDRGERYFKTTYGQE